jgi:hypothetical protein
MKFSPTFGELMEGPEIRAGWLRMLLRVFRRHGKQGIYDDLIEQTQQLIAEAERELETQRGQQERPSNRAIDVR